MIKIMLAMVMGLLLTKQEEEYYGSYADLAEKYTDALKQQELLGTELAGAKADLHDVYHPHARLLIERILLRRLTAPFDLWAADPFRTTEPLPLMGDKSEHWFALVIESSNRIREPSIWIKFWISYPEYSVTPGDWEKYFNIKREGLLLALEHNLAILLEDDPAFMDTMANGEPHLYRLISKDTDVDKLTKKELIY